MDIAEILNPVVELAIPIWMPTNKGTAEIETHTLAAETKICDCQCNVKPCKGFCVSSVK